jgi:hypothetical protein
MGGDKMENNVIEKIEQFNSRLDALYADVSDWVQELGLSTKLVD